MFVACIYSLAFFSFLDSFFLGITGCFVLPLFSFSFFFLFFSCNISFCGFFLPLPLHAVLGRTFIAGRIDAEELVTNGGYWESAALHAFSGACGLRLGRMPVNKLSPSGQLPWTGRWWHSPIRSSITGPTPYAILDRSLCLSGTSQHTHIQAYPPSSWQSICIP